MFAMRRVRLAGGCYVRLIRIVMNQEMLNVFRDFVCLYMKLSVHSVNPMKNAGEMNTSATAITICVTVVDVKRPAKRVTTAI